MKITVCNKCGSPTSRANEDSLEYCNDCGIVEDNTHEEQI